MSKFCKEGCSFLKYISEEDVYCTIYNKKLKKKKKVKRLKICKREENDYRIRNQINDIYTFYNSFVYEMDIMLDNLKELIKGDR